METIGDQGEREPQLARPCTPVLQFGSQSEQAIASMNEELGAEAPLLAHDTPAAVLAEHDFVFATGGSDSVYEEGSPHLDAKIFDSDYPARMIGICYAAQDMVYQQGGTIVNAKDTSGEGRYGPVEITVTEAGEKLGLEEFSGAKMIHSNGDFISPHGLPEGFEILATTGDGDNQHVAMFRDPQENIGIQFHPELSDVVGYGLVRKLLGDVYELDLRPEAIDQFEKMVAEVNEQARGKDVLLGFSGGIDSNAIAEVLVASDVPAENLHIIHIDMGINRTENGITESDILLQRFTERTGLKPDYIKIPLEKVCYEPVELFDEDGQSLGTYTLAEQVDAEMKRKVFSQLYGNAFSAHIEKLGLDPENTLIAQGTLYPDVIESIGKGRVKTHHNLGPFFVKLEREGKILNPARKLFKTDMRQIGEKRGFSEAEHQRQPFPGPGLVTRIIGYDGTPVLPPDAEMQLERLQELIDSDDFAVATADFRTVGQQGDGRSYAHPVLLTSHEEPNDEAWEQIENITQIVGKNFRDVFNRVLFVTGVRVEGVVTPQNMTKTSVTPETVSQLQRIDDKANQIFKRHGALTLDVTAQIPIGLLPTALDSPGARSAFVRPFTTSPKAAFLQGAAVLPSDRSEINASWQELVPELLKMRGIARIAIDATHKPFGSTEGE
ncbi:MAG: hypothetical protein U5L95_04855 [Candidatus Saccharibacteria bacterium]|nr:hypothetical protein [Candidatus Saccharibacteria bacterium]